MKRPDKIKIGPFWYEIVWYDRNEEEERDAFGCVTLPNQIIKICKDRKPQQIASTFIHEIIHVITYLSRTDSDAEEHEQLVTQLAYGFVGVWRDNPKVMEWWVSLL